MTPRERAALQAAEDLREEAAKLRAEVARLQEEADARETVLRLGGEPPIAMGPISLITA